MVVEEIATDITEDPLGVTGAHPERELLQGTEAEEAGPEALYLGAQFVTEVAVTAAALFAVLLLLRHLGFAIPRHHVLRGGGHLLAARALLCQNPPSTPNHLNGLPKKGQGHLLGAPRGRRAWYLTETFLRILVRGEDVFGDSNEGCGWSCQCFGMVRMIECSSYVFSCMNF